MRGDKRPEQMKRYLSGLPEDLLVLVTAHVGQSTEPELPVGESASPGSRWD
jgi:hypothetical protein